MVQGDCVEGLPGPGAQDQGRRQDGQADEHEALRVTIIDSAVFFYVTT